MIHCNSEFRAYALIRQIKILYTALHKCVLSTFLAVFATTSHD